ncbi:hypothetical protein [Rhodococcus sp. NPDC127528]|uniref:hypothetical protein n=1 Tax=unclassified Rhodococcus (in: high G+C Gram-positive bacteria) TaxID=192944 RepID=UPI0036427237
MITWLTALVCSTAVGARIGRLTVRPPSLARVSIAIAAIAVTAAATIRTSTVAEVLDGWHSDAAATSFEICWIAFGAATALIATASFPRLSRGPQWPLPTVFAAVAIAVTANELRGPDHHRFTDFFLTATSTFAVVAGLRYVRWNPLGRAIGLFCAGSLVVAGIGLRALADPDGQHLAPQTAWWSVAIVVISAACSSVMIEAWWRARLDLRRTRRLWIALTAAHPELLDTDYRSATATLTASDRMSQILDGLYLHAGAGIFQPEPTPPPASLPEHAAAVAGWLHRRDAEPIDPAWLAAPDSVSDRRWIGAVCAAYNSPGQSAV